MLYEVITVAAPTRDSVLQRLSALIERGETFALVAPVTVGLESQLDDLAEQKQLPVIGPRITSYNVCYTKLLRGTSFTRFSIISA